MLADPPSAYSTEWHLNFFAYLMHTDLAAERQRKGGGNRHSISCDNHRMMKQSVRSRVLKGQKAKKCGIAAAVTVCWVKTRTIIHRGLSVPQVLRGIQIFLYFLLTRTPENDKLKPNLTKTKQAKIKSHVSIPKGKRKNLNPSPTVFNKSSHSS